MVILISLTHMFLRSQILFIFFLNECFYAETTKNNFLKKNFFNWHKWQKSKCQFKLTPGRKDLKKQKMLKHTRVKTRLITKLKASEVDKIIRYRH